MSVSKKNNFNKSAKVLEFKSKVKTQEFFSKFDHIYSNYDENETHFSYLQKVGM